MSELDDRLARWKQATAQLKPSDELRTRLNALAHAQAHAPAPRGKLKVLLGGGGLVVVVLIAAAVLVARKVPVSSEAVVDQPAPRVMRPPTADAPELQPSASPAPLAPRFAVPREPATQTIQPVRVTTKPLPGRAWPVPAQTPNSRPVTDEPTECTPIPAVQVTQSPLSAVLERLSATPDTATAKLNARLNVLRARSKRFGLETPVIVALRLRLPERTKPSEVAARAEVSEGGWFVAQASAGWSPVWWFMLPGYEPFSLEMPVLKAGEWYLGEVGFQPVGAEAPTLRVRVSSPRRDAEVSLLPDVVCGLDAALHNGAALQRLGNDVTFSRLANLPWRLIVRAPGNELVERRLHLVAGLNDLQVSPRRARTWSVDFMVGPSDSLCAAPVQHARLVASEPLTLADGVTMRVEQRNGVTLFDDVARPGGFLVPGALQEVCSSDLTPRAPFGSQPLNGGEVLVTTTRTGDSVLLRISAGHD